jgi:hypothetical protein
MCGGVLSLGREVAQVEVAELGGACVVSLVVAVLELVRLRAPIEPPAGLTVGVGDHWPLLVGVGDTLAPVVVRVVPGAARSGGNVLVWPLTVVVPAVVAELGRLVVVTLEPKAVVARSSFVVTPARPPSWRSSLSSSSCSSSPEWWLK